MGPGLQDEGHWQAHGAVSFSAPCPPSMGRGGLPGLLREVVMWLVMVQGKVSCMQSLEWEGHLLHAVWAGVDCIYTFCLGTI